MIIAGKEIELIGRPKHRSVIQAQDIMTDWLLKTVDTNDIDQTVPLEVALQRAIVANPKHTMVISQMQQTLAIDQTIMLATGMEYHEIMELREDIYEDEYHDLYSKSREAIGGTAQDFFERYTTNMSLKQLVAKKTSLTQEINVLTTQLQNLALGKLPSETSSNPPKDLSEILTEPSTEKESVTRD